MSITVELPALGESVVEGTITRWLVKEGDRVTQDQPLVEVTTDKVDAEIPAPEAGVVERILVPEGETIPVGTALLVLAPGADAKAAPPAVKASAAKAPAAEPKVAAKPSGPAAPAAPAPAPAPAPRATPVAKRVAEAAGVDLREVSGTGPSGRIMKDDVAQRATAPAPAAPRAPIGAPAPIHRVTPPSAGGSTPSYLHYQVEQGDEIIKMTPLRKIVAEHMVLSKQISPHVGAVAEIDMNAVVRFRDAHKKAFQAQQGFGLTFLPFIVQATVHALRAFPRLNASVLEDAIVEKRAIHVGVAVETEKGLVVPVVRDADTLSLTGIARAIEDLSTRARTKKLSPDDLRGGTFTVSNPGRYGNLYGFAIINQPQVGILRMGEMVKRPVVRTIEGEDAIVIRPIMHLALSYDHRAVDGAPANGFLHHVRELLEAGDLEL
jgi:2-oxoglutarate dehydrogenase E2 component (dihydrolipoamide succinyltransferase)